MSAGAYCMMINCNNNKKDHPELTFFKLPKKMDIALKWIEFSGRKDIDLQKTYTMCSAHFSCEQFKCLHPRKLLYRGSIPCIKGPRGNEHQEFSNDLVSENSSLNNIDIPSTSSNITPGITHNEEEFSNEIIFENISLDNIGIPSTSSDVTHYEGEFGNDIVFENIPLDSVDIPSISRVVTSSNFEKKESGLDIPSTSTGIMRSMRIPKTNKSNGSKKNCSRYSPRTNKKIQKLNRSLNSVRCKLYRKKVPPCFCKGKPVMSSSIASIHKLITEAKRYLSREACSLFANELKSNFVQKNNRRYDDDMKEMCLLWYYASPKGYKAISKCLNLPTTRTLRNWQSHLKVSPGISPAVVKSLEVNISKHANEKKKICVLLFDEIGLSEELHFNQSLGKIVGVVDTGKIRTNDKASTALVCMARGVSYNWRYVIGYWFLGHRSTNEFLHSIVLDCIDAAQEAGLDVTAIICDQSPVNQSVARKLEVSPEKNFFYRNEKKIYFIYDVPHLLKSVRNNLAKYDLSYLGKPVSWKYIQNVCTSVNPLRVRLLPRITVEHMNVTSLNAMRVKYAVQVLSESVSTAILVFMRFGELPAEARFTAEFVSDMDKAFDCLNSAKLDVDKLKMRYAMSADSPHRAFLCQIRDNLKTIRFMSKRSVPPCISGFILSINSILQLAEDLRNIHDIPKLLTRHLNQDPLENFFATVRQQHGCARNPSPQQFEYGLRHNFITSMSKLSANSNCEDDFSFSLNKLTEMSMISSHQNVSEPNTPQFKDVNEIDIDMKDKNAIFYVCGYLVRKFLRLHPCEHCSDILLDKDKLLTGDHQIFTYFKQGEFIAPEDGLLYASQQLFEYIEKLEIIHNAYFEELLHSSNIVKDLMEIVKVTHEIDFALCSPESSERFLNLFMTIRCHWGVRFINQAKQSKVATKNQKLKNLCHE